MKAQLAFIALGALAAPHLYAMPIDQVEHAEREKFMAAANQVIADPLGNENKQRCAFILKFASDSDDISIEVSQKSGVVWLNEKAPESEKYSPILLCAYIAGNARKQLETNEKKPNAEAGIQAVISAYKKIREKKPKFRLKSVDALMPLSLRLHVPNAEIQI